MHEELETMHAIYQRLCLCDRKAQQRILSWLVNRTDWDIQKEEERKYAERDAKMMGETKAYVANVLTGSLK